VKVKAKILDWLKRTQKATGALAGAVGVLASATFLPEPWGGYVAIAGVVLTWLLTYFLPYVQKAVEGFPDELPELPESEPEPGDDTPTAFVGHVLGAVSTDTVEIEKITLPPAPATTVGIPVVEVDDARQLDDPAVTVDEILDRLVAERATV
jgi:hypothetical protein